MEKLLPKKATTTILFVAISLVSLAQFPYTLWDNQYGGTSLELLYAGDRIDQTTDGNLIIILSTTSDDGDVTGNHGSRDAWAMKTDLYGNLLWQKCLGGSAYDEGNAVRATPDGGFVMCGMSKSTDGDLLENNGEKDAWILKADSDGNVEWSQVIGGPDDDGFYDLELTEDGGYIAVGYHGGIGGDVTTAYGLEDGWLVKYSATGTVDWKRAFGGSDNDFLYDIEPTIGGYLLVGDIESDDGNIGLSHNNGGWIAKVDNNGIAQWSSFPVIDDYPIFDFRSLLVNTDGSFYTAGSASYSGPGNTYIVFKYDQLGTMQWMYYADEPDQRSVYNIASSCDGSLLLVGHLLNASEPNYDAWIGKLGTDGSEQWMKTIELYPDATSYACSVFATSADDYFVISHQSSDLRVTRFSNHAGYPAGQIITTPIPVQEICEGSEFVVAYTSTPTNSGNVFTCEMSNSFGDFSNPVALGSFQTQNSGTIVCLIPVSNNVSGYMIRVVSSNPFMIGSAVGFADGNSFTIANTEVIHFAETMGATGATTTVAAHESANAFDMDSYTMSGTAAINANSFSDSYANASAGMNVELGNVAGTFFQIDDITSNVIYDLNLSFGIYKSNNNGSSANMTVEYSTNGTTFIPLTYTLGTGAGTSGWHYVTCAESFSATDQLSLRFTRNSGSSSVFRIDDILLTKAGTPNISGDGPSEFCAPDDIMLTAEGGAFYLWSTSEDTPSIVVDSGIETYYCYITSLNGCVIKSNEIEVTAGPTLYYVDEDNDGYGNTSLSNNQCEPWGIYQVLQGGDCNDDNADFNPGEIETCDGFDNNCNGEVDEGFDNDNDGYNICDGDCDDHNAVIHPGANDVVNGVDDNCDGIADQPAENIWYLDNDDDGYGTPFHVSNNEIAPTGYVSNYMDCDDDDASRYPTAEDGCGDNIDNNCDGIVDNCLCVGDLDGNGAVNVGDLLIFTSVFGSTCD